MRVLVTGGFGYLGGRVAQALFAAGHSVVLGTRRTMSAPPWLTQAEVVRLDWTDASALGAATARVDGVVHLAGMNARDCQRDPVAALEFNGVATARLLQSCVGTTAQRFLYVSTAHVYAAPLRGVITEASNPEALHPYATSHRAGEDVVRTAHRSGAIQGIVLRLSNAIGPPAHADADCWMLVAQDLARQAVQTSRMVLTTSGLQRRDFVAVSDVCAAIVHSLAMPVDVLGNGVFNLGGGWNPSVFELADRIADRVELVIGTRPAIERPTPLATEVSEALCYDRSKLLATGFIPKPDSIDHEIDDLIRFCSAHRPGGQ